VVPIGPNNRKEPGGLGGLVMIAESHLSFHAFPSLGCFAIDIYSCQNDLDCDGVAARINRAFGIAKADVHVQPRGLRYPAQDLVPA
jgi:S-adenosylmethionine decarboxylase